MYLFSLFTKRGEYVNQQLHTLKKVTIYWYTKISFLTKTTNY